MKDQFLVEVLVKEAAKSVTYNAQSMKTKDLRCERFAAQNGLRDAFPGGLDLRTSFTSGAYTTSLSALLESGSDWLRLQQPPFRRGVRVWLTGVCALRAVQWERQRRN